MKREALFALSLIASTAATEVPVGASQDPTVQQAINAADLPSHLPDALERVAADVVLVNEDLTAPVTVDGEKMGGGTDYSGLSGSGIRIGKNKYLTAGHVLINGTTDKPFYSSISCSHETIDITTKKKTAFIYSNQGNVGTNLGKQIPLYGTDIEFEKSYGTYSDISGLNTNIPDAAIIEASSSKDSLLKRDIPVGISRNSANVGEGLYFENFEPTRDKHYDQRDPDENHINYEHNVQSLGKPAIYGGVVIDHLKNGDLVVLNGLKSYGATPANYTIEGASGGPVFNINGKLVGTSVDGLYSKNGKETVAEIDSELDIHINAAQSSELAITVVQPITTKLISKLTNGLKTAPDCLEP
jgi:V8-like Glu-specific endopeptidase